MVHILLVIIYLAFISLGLPDSLLGSAWPVMHLKFCVPISWAGAVSMIGFVAIGVGSAPIYPSLIHSTPDHSGADRSQAIIGVQMASAYLGTCLMPPLFGVIADAVSAGLMPLYLLILLVLMFAAHEKLTGTAEGV
jgi:fucose permease